MYQISLGVAPENRIWHCMQIVSKTGFDIACKLCPKQDLTFHDMKCQTVFSGKNITNLSSAELSQRVVKINNNLFAFLICLQQYSWNVVNWISTFNVQITAAADNILNSFFRFFFFFFQRNWGLSFIWIVWIKYHVLFSPKKKITKNILECPVVY